MSDSVDLTGLDYDFLRYTGVNPAMQRQNQSLYLPFFKDCRRVIDVGCGDGDFVELLREQGVDAFGVDNDPIAVRQLRERQVPVVEADVVNYLRSLEPGSLDGVFAAHLVEHLPYQAVYEMLHHAHRALKPDGRIVLTTPNARALVSHLEMYWLHFGHVAFYHPRLLCFFLHQAGFRDETWGENPAPAHPLFGEPSPYEFLGDQFKRPVDWAALPAEKELSGWRRTLRARFTRLLGLDDIVRQANDRLRQLAAQANLAHAEIDRLNAIVDRVDRPFECYATAIKK